MGFLGHDGRVSGHRASNAGAGHAQQCGAPELQSLTLSRPGESGKFDRNQLAPGCWPYEGEEGAMTIKSMLFGSHRDVGVRTKFTER